MKHILLVALLALFICCARIVAQPLPVVVPETVGMSSEQLRYADRVILQAIADKQMPGAVLAVVKDNKMVYLKAYGHKALRPDSVPMDTDAVFDLASLTKPIATATSAMILIERGQLRLADKVNQFIPQFQGWKTEEEKTVDIRVLDLLAHTSGLPPYAPVETLEKQYGSPNPEGLIEYIASCPRDFEPRTDMQYSCLNYVVLQRIIETIAGQPIHQFAAQNIFEPLGMKHTAFIPQDVAKIVPTEIQKDSSMLHGVVHDPLARVMNGGISGNAGLFADATDLAVFATALQNGGAWNGKRILSPLGVEAMRTAPRTVAPFGRALGWDLFSPYASNTGDLLSPATYGHTGYTGTSLVIDPDNKLSIILLTNKAHPYDKGNVIRLRSLVANAVAAALLNRTGALPTATPAWSYEAHRAKRLSLFAKEAPITSSDIVMLGNSLTEGGKWDQLLANKNIRNRGIIGDATVGILSRLEPIIQGKPSKLFLLIGVNDIANGVPADSIAKNIAAILHEITTHSPRTKIYLQSLLPTNQSFGRYKRLDGKTAVIIDTNKRIKKLAKRYKVEFIDLYRLFTTTPTSDTLRKELTGDGLHLNQAGYLIWAEKLKNFL